MSKETLLIIAFGCIGGFLPDVLRIIKGRYESTPGYLKSGTFYLGLVLLVALGGFAAWLLGANEIKEAVAYGFAAPELISKLGADTNPDRGDAASGRISLRQWWGV
jgi:hypothetical protein